MIPPGTDTEPDKETVGFPFSDTEALRDGKVPVKEAVSPRESLGVPKTDIDALKHRRSVQPYARLDNDGEGMIATVSDADAPREAVGLPFNDADSIGSGKEPVTEAVAPMDIVESP